MAATAEESNNRYCFVVDWHDVHADITRSYQLFFYPADQTAEMYDVKQRRTFLKRTRVDAKLQNLYIGAVVVVNARQLVVRGYGDEFTRAQLEQRMERTMLFIKPHAISRVGEILDTLLKKDFIICRCRMVQLTRRQAEGMVKGELSGRPGYSDILASMECGRALAVELMKPRAISELRDLAGPELVQDAMQSLPSSLRALYGENGHKNGVHVPSSPDGVKQAVDAIFNDSAYSQLARTARFQDCTLALIRPHAVNDGLTGQIIKEITKAGYHVTDMELFRLDKSNAEEFLEVYKGVISEYHHILDQLTSGPVIALEITGKPNIVSEFREFCGPMDPELSHVLRPNSLRAKFGVDQVHNAVHCTDLDEDGVLEVQYFFRILAS
ncbi:nucleoside-diphosphate kinase [Spizellomyces sp. 'palustris']|nr:nucleoside-diphosphate kinase [Spizellomyces sp. 'palustris']